MVKKKAKTKKTISVFDKQIPSWTLVPTLILLALVGFIGYNAYLNEQDHQKFVRMEETVTELANRINEKFGTETVKSETYCYKASRKFEAEPTICTVRHAVEDIDNISVVSEFLGKQEDIVEGVYRSLNIYDLAISKQDFGCRLENEGVNFTLSCSSYARSAVYPINE